MLNQRKNQNIGKIAVIGNYLPRQCGIATFTTDLSQSLARELTIEDNLINVAMDDIPEGYKYPPQVKFRVRQNVQSDYFWAADYLNANQYDAAIVQHEYGIYGGEDGSHILQMIQSLKMPVITNLHTVLEHPTEGQRKVMKGLAKYSDRLLVMSKKAIDILTKVYGIDRKMISFIPHGVPDADFKAPGVFNELFGLENKDVILTFGLLGPDKGIESMIEAMPLIVKEHPNVIYLILGQTHPHIIEKSGDSYRRDLQRLVNRLGMQNHIVFHNHFVKIETLIQYLQTAKIYAIPYLKKEQITSGTLSYALGVGTAVVSTPFWHAEELLADGRGKLVPFDNPAEMAKEINNLLSNDAEREMMRFKGYQYGRSMIWKEVAKTHLNLISEIKGRKPLANIQEIGIKYHKIFNELPEINLSHLKTMTDDTGLLQHAKYMTPNFHHGYCVDDNARGLIAITKYYSLRKDKVVLPLIQKYLAFLFYAFNKENGRFRNFMSYDRRWMELAGSEDSHARALWGLGVTVKEAPDSAIRNMAMRLFLESLPVVEHFTSPRAWGFTVLGLQAYLTIYGGDISARKVRDDLARKIYELFKNNISEDWHWCEGTATYANAILPHALIVAGKWIPDQEMYETGIKALEWLLKVQTAPEGHLSVIGNDGWLDKNGNRSMFDQQPIEVKSLIDACLDTYIETGDKKWFTESERCLSWFLGQNDLGLPVCDYKTGGCGDGLESQGVNGNQGAESTLAWIISLISMHTAMGLQFHLDENI
ncbi:MAG: glycosyltransferase family 4 protein [Candidatus Gastranaerophilaceae bacterium]